jgi:glucoamylase
LITSAAAEFLYDAVAQWKARQSLSVDATSLAFFQDLFPSVTISTYTGNSDSAFMRIIDGVTAYADSFVAVVEKYTPSNGSLSEEFNRDTGLPLSAYDLTWSYAAFVTMAQRRAGQYPASWGASNAATCGATSVQGVYAPAVAAGAPNMTSSCQINIVFDVNATTYYGENLYVIGNTTDVGAWDISNALPMGAGDYTSEWPLWSVSTYLTAGEAVSYTYVRQEDCNQPYIYETVNYTLTVPACGGEGTATNDAWVGPVGTSGNC